MTFGDAPNPHLRHWTLSAPYELKNGCLYPGRSTLDKTIDRPTDEKKKANRTDKGQGSLFKRGRVWTFNAPNGKQYSTGQQTKSEAVQFKHKKIEELRTEQPEVSTKARKRP